MTEELEEKIRGKLFSSFDKYIYKEFEVSYTFNVDADLIGNLTTQIIEASKTENAFEAVAEILTDFICDLEIEP